MSVTLSYNIYSIFDLLFKQNGTCIILSRNNEYNKYNMILCDHLNIKKKLHSLNKYREKKQ